jgi:hypothetical protein
MSALTSPVKYPGRRRSGRGDARFKRMRIPLPAAETIGFQGTVSGALRPATRPKQVEERKVLSRRCTQRQQSCGRGHHPAPLDRSGIRGAKYSARDNAPQ